MDLRPLYYTYKVIMLNVLLTRISNARPGIQRGLDVVSLGHPGWPGIQRGLTIVVVLPAQGLRGLQRVHDHS